MERDDFNNAAKTLEDAFFAKENARLLQQMRDRAKQQERRAAMRDVVRVNVYGGRPMLVGKLVEVLRDVVAGKIERGRIVLSPVYGRLEDIVTPDDLLAPVEAR